jgi:hypothetical protein
VATVRGCKDAIDGITKRKSRIFVFLHLLRQSTASVLTSLVSSYVMGCDALWMDTYISELRTAYVGVGYLRS